jgi:hypothetical protein
VSPAFRGQTFISAALVFLVEPLPAIAWDRDRTVVIIEVSHDAGLFRACRAERVITGKDQILSAKSANLLCES